jgi:hypothetical protein
MAKWPKLEQRYVPFWVVMGIHEPKVIPADSEGIVPLNVVHGRTIARAWPGHQTANT